MTNKQLQQIKSDKPTYKDMIDYCCDNLILNNNILKELAMNDIYFEPFCGEYYNEDTEQYADVMQYYIVDAYDAVRLDDYTDEIVLYNDDLQLYLLAVTHWGTAWNGVPANWKDNIGD